MRKLKDQIALRAQHLLQEVDRELDAIDDCTQLILKELPSGDLRRTEGEKILAELAALHRFIAEGMGQVDTSVP